MKDYEYAEDEIDEYMDDVHNLEYEEFEHFQEEEYWKYRCREEFLDRVLSGDWT